MEYTTLNKINTELMPWGIIKNLEEWLINNNINLKKISLFHINKFASDCNHNCVVSAMFDFCIFTYFPKSIKIVYGDLDFRGLKVVSFNNVTEIHGNVDLRNTKIKSLGSLKFIHGNLDLRRSCITKIPKNLTVYGVIDKDF